MVGMTFSLGMPAAKAVTTLTTNSAMKACTFNLIIRIRSKAIAPTVTERRNGVLAALINSGMILILRANG
jgi:hypothetical protein